MPLCCVQVKEVGVLVENCSCLAQDAARIFGIYWDIGDRKKGSLPPHWPGRFSALFSANHPLVVNVNGVPARIYLSVSYFVSRFHIIMSMWAADFI